jgi:adenine-specific DNA methylase
MTRPRVLIEQWLPIDQIGAECMRERGASSALPPLYFLHVWWARRPLTVSRAAILASLLPAYPTGDDDSIRAWPQKFLKRFPSFDAYKQWFLKLIGIQGNPAASRKIIDWAKTKGIKLTPAIMGKLPPAWKDGLPSDMGISIPYGYPRAFTYNPTEEQLETLYDLLEWTWGTREITFCDPMSGGGSIPFEALRFGLTVHANEYNPVASVILKGTLEYPARFGPSLAEDIRKYGNLWCNKVRGRLAPYYPLSEPTENIFAYVWARTVPCPVTGKPVPLSPNWWLLKLKDSAEKTWIGVSPQIRSTSEHVEFKLVRGTATRDLCNKGSIKGGTAVSPWKNEPIESADIKTHAQAGRMGQQLYAIGIKTEDGLDFRTPTELDLKAFAQAEKDIGKLRARLELEGMVPIEAYPTPSTDMRPVQYGMPTWADFYSPRQLLATLTIQEEFRRLVPEIQKEIKGDRAEAVITYLGLACDKCADYNSRMVRWHSTRGVIAGTFDRHDFSFKWSHAEFDAARKLLPWAVDQVADASGGIASLVFPAMSSQLFAGSIKPPTERLTFSRGKAQDLKAVRTKSIRHICVDPPYEKNVQYAECSDFYYVWLKRSLGTIHPSLLGNDDQTPKDEEAVANPARFTGAAKKRDALALQDYQKKMAAAFAEMRRVLADDGILTVMFTHKKVEAWDTLGAALIQGGFAVNSSWPVTTESKQSLHQAKKNSAQSTIMLSCRKREKSAEPVWWDDLKSKVRQTARQKAAEFEKQGIKGVDLYISTFGPVLSIISENWPVLTSETDPKTGDPLPLKPGEALDLAREEVINLRKQGLLLGRSVEFDPITDWYLMAWDAFRAQEFPADEARKLALALGLDLEKDVTKDKKLVAKKSGTVVLCKPTDRRKKNMVDPDADSFPHLIDALHTAMMIYDE